MNSKDIDGRKIANKINEKNKLYIKGLKDKPLPKLVVIQVGNNPASDIYIRMKKKACENVGIIFEHIQLEETTTETSLIAEIGKHNDDPGVTGIIVQSPLPKHLDWNKIINFIDDNKDADGFSHTSQGRVVVGENLIAPATAKGIFEILKDIKFNPVGKHVVILGRSNIVGKPIANILINQQATVTICNSKTEKLKDLTKRADLLIVAIGKANFINKNFINKGQIVIDVGSNFLEGRYCGDVNYEDVYNLVARISPVPGGVGPMTVASLLDNVIVLYKLKIFP